MLACMPVLTRGHVESWNDQAADMFVSISFSWTAVMEGLDITHIAINSPPVCK